MPNLRDLSLFGFSTFGSLNLSDCPFKLRSLLVTPPTDSNIAGLIRNQPTIVDLNLAAFTLSHQCVNTDYFLDSKMLPELRTITGCPKTIATLAPGRPVTHVIMRTCSVHNNYKADIDRSVVSLDRTSAPIQILHFDFDKYPEINAWDFVGVLKTTKAPLSLERLTIRVTLLDFATQQAKNPNYITELAQLLQGFTCLRYFEVEEAEHGLIEEQPSSREVIDMVFAVLERQTDLSALWKGSCPTLTTLKLFDKTIF
ncbi:hypothetical protein RSOLAG1IB_11127 [Rhizoctonia solani AG-1 IB]|uniref:Uncharacterized protein n=1 Tax=Thanatephorus cucumeris (strain AG1-IB / isolate 7/3/14) TaxID=1108050 RepID=A0A0B7F989_THACB|nr:hypothetical protein RSOLAG1IB_11127 [Rhizoctonia solani AG-1 IB]